jgi:glycosyltransferase involved in cell wall biosynthesis
MMTSLGHEVFLYGGSENDAKVTEFVAIVSDQDRKDWFGHLDFNKDVFNDWNSNSECWQTMNIRASWEIHKRKQPGDFLCIIAGVCQQQILHAVPSLQAVEWGIGYEGVIPNVPHVFESSAWMHYIYGKHSVGDGNFKDTVIPNSFDEEDYVYRDKKENYLLYLGRLTPRKGLSVVSHLAKRGHRILVAGQGTDRIENTEYLGVVRGSEKAELLANAMGVLVPTHYIEPFGGVAVESMLSGTPVITTDFGAFRETVIDGMTGFRCSSLKDFEDAANNVALLFSNRIRQHAEQYLTKFVRYDYDNYFKRLCDNERS